MGLYYLQTNTICMLILLIVNIALRNKKSAMPARRLAFTRLIQIAFVICLSDILAWYCNGNTTPGTKYLIHLANIIYDGAITASGLAWLNYVELRIRPLEYNYKRFRRLSIIPMAIMTALLVTNPMTGFLFTVDENNVYARAGGIFVHWIISWGYLVIALWEVIRKIRKAKSRAEKSQLWPMIWFIVPPAAAAILQMFFYGLTSTQCGITLSILIIAINFLRDEISKDTLTGLNNRRALENYLTELLQRGEAELTVMMCDVDKFKTINDTLGHTAGDLVLKRMADGLKKVCGGARRSLFLCRYGGDEFVICGAKVAPEEREMIASDLEKTISAMNADYGDHLGFGISVGHATGACSNYEDVEQLLGMADAVMYSIKKAKKAARE